MSQKKKKKAPRQQKKEHPSLNEQLLLQRGEELFQEGRYAEAAETWKRVLKQVPQAAVSRRLAEAYFRNGLLCSQAGDLRQAVSDLSQAAHYGEGVALYHYHLALARHRQGNLPKALVSYQKALEQEKTSPRYLYHYGLALMDQGQPEKALSLFLERARREPREIRWKWGLVNLYLHWGRKEELTRLLESLDPASLKGSGIRTLRGIFHLVKGDPKQAPGSGPGQALRELEVALQEGDPEGVTRYALGVLSLRQGDLERASDHWEVALQRGYLPVREPLARLYRLVGDRSLQAGREAEARAAWEKVLQFDLGDAPTVERLVYLQWAEGCRLASAGKSAEAAQVWREAMRLKPEEPRLAYNLALLAEESKEHEEAVRMWETAIRGWQKALQEAGDAAQKDRLVLAYRHLSRSYLKLDRWGRAMESLKAAIQLCSADPSLLLEAGNLCLDRGEERQALAYLKRAHALQPENLEILNGLAAVYEAWGEEEVAQGYWERALQLDPDNRSARERLLQLYTSRAHDHWEEGEIEEALEVCEKGRQLFPRDPKLPILQGEIYLDIEEWHKAEETFRQAMAINPQDPLVPVAIGHRYLHLRRKKKKAEEYFQVALRIAPASAKICQEIGKACLCAKDVKRIRHYFDRALELAPQDSQLPLELGRLLQDNGYVKLAQPYLERAIRMSPDAPYPRYLLGCAYDVLGLFKKARKAWDEALRLAQEQGDTRLAQEIVRRRSGRPPGPSGLFSLFGKDEEELF